MYGALFERGSGTEISGGLTPGVHYERQKAKDAISKRTVPTLRVDVLLTYEKLVNLYWQHSASAGLYGQYGRQIYKDSDMSFDDYSTGLTGKYAWGFYPTSRTNLNFHYNRILGDASAEKKDNFMWNGNYNATLTYSLF